jgi:hypothetical protein
LVGVLLRYYDEVFTAIEKKINAQNKIIEEISTAQTRQAEPCQQSALPPNQEVAELKPEAAVKEEPVLALGTPGVCSVCSASMPTTPTQGIERDGQAFWCYECLACGSSVHVPVN